MKLLLPTMLTTLLLASVSASADRSDRAHQTDRFKQPNASEFCKYADDYKSKYACKSEYKRKLKIDKQFGNGNKHLHSAERSRTEWELILEFSNISGLSISHVAIIFDQYQHQGLAMVAFKLGVSRSSTDYRRILQFSSFKPWTIRIEQYDSVRSFDRVTLDRVSRR